MPDERTGFFSRPNTATDAVTPIKPWEIVIPDEIMKLPKAEYKARWLNPMTKHYLFTMAEGLNPEYRVSTGNQAARLYGVMADYDGAYTPDLIDALKRKPVSKYLPRYWCRSHSGKLHLFWFFDSPVTVTGNAHANALLKIIRQKIKVPFWGLGSDPKFELVTQEMDIGYGWEVFREGAAIPNDEIVLWDIALFNSKARDYVQDVVDIPLEVVVNEIRKRKWPKEPPGDLVIGTRCHRFWDPSGDNPTAAQLTKDGFRVYTPHDNGFKSWKSLLGAEFCEEFTATSMAPFYRDTFYCETKDEYYRFFANETPPRFEKRTEKVLRRDLMMEAMLSPKPAKGETQSDIDKALWTINRKNSVKVVAPLLYREAGLRTDEPDLGRALNTSLVVVKAAAPYLNIVKPEDLDKFPACPKKYRENPLDVKWDNPFAVEKFPHIHRFLTGFFMTNQMQFNKWVEAGAPTHDDNGLPKPWLMDTQLIHLISWLAHFYQNAARMTKNPGRGQALILAGPAGVGKSFFGCTLLGELMGGATDGKDFYLKGGRFNSGIVGCPVHYIDDQLGSTSHKLRLQFTEALKVTVANARLRYEAKFGSAVEAVRWPGRIVILANDDAQSLSVLPDLDMSTKDKFMMLKAGGVKFLWGSDDENKKWLAEELPYFAKFLIRWNIPEEIRDDRFGVEAIQHGEMAQASAENGLTHTLVEVLEACIEKSREGKDAVDPGDRDGYVIEGNAIQILKWITGIDPTFLKEVVDSHVLRQSLSTLYKNGSFGIAYDEDTKVWKIPYVLRKKSENKVDADDGGMV